ncbi:hypothetical protein, partial [Corallococcus exercitus]|uniref:hypothetical protein n=1 Tax=Corallococcus exercitus TaxID=2316736 RepID=UPI001C0F5094
MSLPGVQVGDSVEVEYLLPESDRGPAQPGFTASAFYFQIANGQGGPRQARSEAPLGKRPGSVPDTHLKGNMASPGGLHYPSAPLCVCAPSVAA